MKLCFSTLGCTEKSLAEILALADVFQMQGLEIRGIGGQLHNGIIPDFREETATETKELLQKHGICPAVLGTSCMFHTEEKRSAAMTEGAESIRIAARLGIPYIRVFGNNLTEDPACTDRVTEGIAALCRLAAGKSISVLLEVHGDFNTVETLTPVIRELASADNFGLIWDIGHTHRPYGADWRTFYRALRPFIRHVHVKDFSAEKGALVLPGRGDIPITDILTEMLANGYDGFFSLEWERHWHPSLPPIEEALIHFRALCEKVQIS